MHQHIECHMRGKNVLIQKFIGGRMTEQFELDETSIVTAIEVVKGTHDQYATEAAYLFALGMYEGALKVLRENQ